MHLVSDWGPLHPLSFARTLLKMCNEPRTIDFQAQGLTGGEQHRNIFFFFSFFFLHYTFLSLDLQYLRVLFLSRVFYSNLLHRVLLFFLPQSYRWKTTIVLVSFYALFYSMSSKPSPNASCTSFFLSSFLFSSSSLFLSFFLFFILFYFIFIRVGAQAMLYTLRLLETIELHEWKLNRNARRRS